MKNVILSVLIFFAAADAAVARNIKYKVVKDGNIQQEININKKSGIYYLNFSDVAKIYGVLPHFYPVSKKAALRFLNNKLEVFYNSEQIVINNSLKTLDVPAFSSKNTLYVPVSLILSEPFSEISKYNAEIRPSAKKIIITKRISVRQPEVLSYSDLTRITVDFDSVVSYKSAALTAQSVTYEFTNGFCLAPYEKNVYDGVVGLLKMYNRGANALLEIHLMEGAGAKKEYVFKKEKVITIDFERSPLAQEDKTVRKTNAPPPEEAIAAATNEPDSGGLQPEPVLALYDEKLEAEAVSTDAGIDEAGGLAAAVAKSVDQIKEKFETAGKEAYSALKRGKKPLIVLDPGHGGKDPGAIGAGGVKEKVLNLAFAKKMVPILKKNGYDVMLTRDDDTFVALMDRTEFANRVGADLFVSIHCNSSLNAKKRGFEAYFLSETASDPQAEATARLENAVIALEGGNKKRKRQVQEVLFSMAQNAFMNQASELSAIIKENVKKSVKMEQYDVRQAGFHVLKGARMPAVLVECGYISNKSEEIFISKEDNQKKIAEGLAKGIIQYGMKRLNEK